jgi:sugar lactone lactonase YvrE
LTGFPFPVGGASVWRTDGSGAPTEYATGFTNIVDIRFGRDGALYVLQFTTTGLLTGNPLGALIRVDKDGTRSQIAPGSLISPGGFAIARDGSIYVSRFGNLPGAGDVVRIRPQD